MVEFMMCLAIWEDGVSFLTPAYREVEGAEGGNEGGEMLFVCASLGFGLVRASMLRNRLVCLELQRCIIIILKKSLHEYALPTLGDGSHHPVVNLRQCQSLVRRGLNGFGYQIGVRKIPPSITARGCFPRGLLGSQAAGGQRARGGRRGVRGERGASALLAGGGERPVGHGAVAALVIYRQVRVIDTDGRTGIISVSLLSGFVVLESGRGSGQVQDLGRF
ncbi:hypothetical protein EYF80_025304 [Liparis tanakae]|uniref:Uncharacterized protein n=1 Tax=Liparis tanakae TaxID=230148 RepID=A0A4Z2HHN0_9TELE|nr:hypothetical protein EYF80_025304 [Liparis tanakae]